MQKIIDIMGIVQQRHDIFRYYCEYPPQEGTKEKTQLHIPEHIVGKPPLYYRLKYLLNDNSMFHDIACCHSTSCAIIVPMNSHFDIYGLVTTKISSVPYVSEGIPAGFPSPATDYIGDRIDLNEVLILNPGATYYARVRDYYMVEEELEQGDGILFDTSLAPRSGDLALCEVCGERVLKYIRKRGREIWLLGGGTDTTVSLDGDTEARVLGIVTVVIKIRQFKKRRTRLIDLLPQKEQPALFERRAIRASYFPERDVTVEGLVDLNEELIPNPVSTFFGKVKGISLIDDDIDDNDSVIVDRMLEPQWGDLAVCVTQDGFTMKYVEVRDNGEVWLMPGNKEYNPIRITEDNERLVWGIVTHSVRQLRIKKGDKK